MLSRRLQRLTHLVFISAPKALNLNLKLQRQNLSLLSHQRFYFATPAAPGEEKPAAGTKNTDSSNKNKITAKTLCEMTGTKYYIHNEEIQYQGEKILRVFDENDKLLGDMPFREAY